MSLTHHLIQGTTLTFRQIGLQKAKQSPKKRIILSGRAEEMM